MLSAFAPAKLNLYLHVGPLAADGFHPLSSLMVFADVGDVLTFEPNEEVVFAAQGPFGALAPMDDANLVVRAARAIWPQARGGRLTLEKRLPIAAGLGGGSSDAGAALRLLRSALDLPLEDAALEVEAAALGSDGVACFWRKSVIAEGRGERLSPAPSMPVLDAVLVNPGVPSPTGAVYRAYDAAPRDAARPATPGSFPSVEAVAGWLGSTRNDLQTPAVALAPAIGEVLSVLADQPESLFVRMSGSGSTCFALCSSQTASARLAGRLAAFNPTWWVRAARLGSAPSAE
jgi:4-diphosphocytidyl-2-C-methyl-D-erythritol kinase